MYSLSFYFCISLLTVLKIVEFGSARGNQKILNRYSSRTQILFLIFNFFNFFLVPFFNQFWLKNFKFCTPRPFLKNVRNIGQPTQSFLIDKLTLKQKNCDKFECIFILKTKASYKNFYKPKTIFMHYFGQI